MRAYSFKGTWTIAAACFAGLVLIWLAIAALDLLYYNRLLVGSVAAIKEIETLSENETHVTHLNLSTRIEEAVKGTSAWPSCGVLAFYLIVFLTLATGLEAPTYSACNYPPPKAEADDGLVRRCRQDGRARHLSGLRNRPRPDPRPRTSFDP